MIRVSAETHEGDVPAFAGFFAESSLLHCSHRVLDTLTMCVSAPAGAAGPPVCTLAPSLTLELVPYVPDTPIPPPSPHIAALLPLEAKSPLSTVPEPTPVQRENYIYFST